MALCLLRRPQAFVHMIQPLKASPTRLVSRNFTTQQRPLTLRSLRLPLATKPTSQLVTKRFTTEPAISVRPDRSEALRKLAYSGAIFGGTLLAINVLFNQEGREGSLSGYERQYLKETFTYTGLGVGMIGVVGKALHNVGWSYRLMAANPWMVFGVGLAGSVGTMMGVFYTNPENYIQKHVMWSGFNITQGLLLAPLYFYSPAILARAALYTVGMMGSISYVAITAKEDKYLWLGAPLLGGVAVVALSSLAPMILPLGSRALVASEAISLYGGLAVFGGFTLFDVQKILHNARNSRKDPVAESVSLELDFINILIRMVQILGNQQNRR